MFLSGDDKTQKVVTEGVQTENGKDFTVYQRGEKPVTILSQPDNSAIIPTNESIVNTTQQWPEPGPSTGTIPPWTPFVLAGVLALIVLGGNK